MVNKVFSYVKAYRMIEEGDTVITGVSGGADSVCLLFVLLKLREKIPFFPVVVHVNHQVREDAGEDALFVEALCKKWQVPFYMVSEDMKAYALANRLSEEEAGREIRYRAFEDILLKEYEKKAIDLTDEAGKEAWMAKAKIAVAHNSNDRAETMLFHLFRGTGLKGACGIRPVSGRIIRPLLSVSREEIEAYLELNGLDFCTDSTNASDDYTRNRIRHHILPFAEQEICSGAVSHMNRAAEEFQMADAFIQKEVLAAKERCRIGEGLPLQLDITVLQKEDEYLQGRVLFSFLEELVPGCKDLTAEHISNLQRLMAANGSKELSLPYHIRAGKEYNILTFGQKKQESEEKDAEIKETGEYVVLIGGRLEVPGLGMVESRIFPALDTENIPRKTYTKWFDYDKITTSACFRTRKAGDYLCINKQAEHKLLQDYFVNEKIPRKQRDSLYVLADGSHILWVPGYRISEHYKVTQDTEKILEIKIIQDAKEERSHQDG
ncbi:MAG: tRNA lysidine(34) synthetase TilS [Lachnospiraceae bacterium]|nr:tRNA lysidine(34) synthetase TilS [Lachnospiraceae bacterium]